jgi:hypothetical protein
VESDLAVRARVDVEIIGTGQIVYTDATDGEPGIGQAGGYGIQTALGLYGSHESIAIVLHSFSHSSAFGAVSNSDNWSQNLVGITIAIYGIAGIVIERSQVRLITV